MLGLLLINKDLLNKFVNTKDEYPSKLNLKLSQNSCDKKSKEFIL